MITRRKSLLVLGASAAALRPHGAAAQQGGGLPGERNAGLALPARTIPVPKSVSPEAQAVLARPMPAELKSPDPADKAGWETYVRERDQALTQALAPRGAPETLPRLTEQALSRSMLYELEPRNISEPARSKALFFLHGGGYTNGGGIAAAYAAYGIAQRAGLRTFSSDYRMPPAWPFPAALDDAVEAYRQVVGRYGAQNVAVYGPSAGGGLAAACLLKARAVGLPLPAACVLHSPEVDLTESGDSFATNLGLDPLLRTSLRNAIALYAGGHDLRDPYLSPLFGDFTKGFPPTFLASGTRDLFLSNTVLMHAALRRADVRADLYIGEAMGHGGFFGAAPEDQALADEQVKFLREHLGF